MQQFSQDNYKHYSLCFKITSGITVALVLLCAYLAVPILNNVATQHDKVFLAFSCVGLVAGALLTYTNYDFLKMFKPGRVAAG